MPPEDDENGLDGVGEEAIVGTLDTSIEYTGRIKSFNMRVGHGYIESDDVKAAIGQDVYVHQNTLVESGAHVNYAVQFKIHLNHKGLPQAQSPLVVLEEGVPAEHVGTIKSFVTKSNYGFVSCEQTHEQYGRDVYLPGSKFEGFEIGQEVYFDVDMNGDMPVVQRLYPVTISVKGKGEGKGGKTGKGASAPPQTGAAASKGKPAWTKAAAAAGKPGSVGKAPKGAKAFPAWDAGWAGWAYPAAGKGPSWGAGWAVDPWQNAGACGGWGTGWMGGKAWGKGAGPKAWKGGKMAAEPAVTPARPAGKATLKPQAPLQPARQPGKATPQAAGKASPKAGKALAKAPQGAVAVKRKRSESNSDGRKYVGVVKRFNMRVAHGYIECDEIKAEIEQDVYVHQNTLAESEANVGYTVQFQVHFNEKGLPQAESPLEIIETANPGQYWGVIKSFVMKQAYGFVECEETKAEYGRDVFLPLSKAQGFYIGQNVFFNIDLNEDGMPVVLEMFPSQFESDKITKPKAILDLNPDKGKGEPFKGKGESFGPPTKKAKKGW